MTTGLPTITRPPRAFTLLETLIAISLIATLLSMLLPALSGAKESAREILCAANLRQLQLANELYAGEHTDAYLPGAEGIQTTNLLRWHGGRTQVGESFRAEFGPITSYLENSSTSTRLRVCPTFAPTLDALADSGAGFERAGGGYGYNNAFVGVVRARSASGAWIVQRDDQGSRRSRFTRPNQTIAFADAAFADASGVNNLIEYSFAEPNFWPDFPGFRPNPSIHFRHAHGANVVWLDGHVSRETRTRSWAGFGFGADAEQAGLGWFGDRDTNELFDYD